MTYEANREAAYATAYAEMTAGEVYAQIKKIVCHVPHFTHDNPDAEGWLDGLTDAMRDRGYSRRATEEFSRVVKGWHPDNPF